ncbi:hypothetical protein [Bacillus anthracis]|uniref:hypothetical protein n=1 Tax=Bacillus anthracis TaxID=1392 RepID=UPI000D3C3D3E|nr:hypothetical protein [Bacillus anthracis]PTR88690.1 hypothetical protein DBA57_30580 [Bacillus anthracis]
MIEYDIWIITISIIFGLWQYWSIIQIQKLRREVIYNKKKLSETRQHFIDFAKEYNRLLGVKEDNKND